MTKITLDSLAIMIKTEFDTVHSKLDNLTDDVVILKEDVSILKDDVKILKKDVAILKEDVAILKEDVSILKTDMKIVKEKVTNLEISQEDQKARMSAVAYRVELRNLDQRVQILEKTALSTS